MRGIRINIHDVTLHTDAIHRGGGTNHSNCQAMFLRLYVDCWTCPYGTHISSRDTGEYYKALHHCVKIEIRKMCFCR